MEGITILNTVESTTLTNASTLIVFSGIVLAIVLGLIAVILVDAATNAAPYVLGLAAAIFIFSFLTAIFGPKEPYIKHQVLIDESVSMTEFHDKYILLEQDGEIYTIIEKELSE